MTQWTRAAAILLVALASQALAEEPPQAEAAADWRVAAGPGVYVAPRYPGAAHSLVFPVIYQDIDYRGRYFSRGFDLAGIYAVNTDAVQAGADLQFDPTWRHASDAPELRHLGNVNPTARARAFVQATYSLVTLSADIAQDIAGQHQGLLANGDLLFSLPAGQWLITAGPGLTWTDRTYMRTFFGISPAQASVSGLPVHPVDAGVREWHGNLYVTGNFGKYWSTVIGITLAKLRGDAATSPITVSRRQVTSMAALTWRFR